MVVAAKVERETRASFVAGTGGRIGSPSQCGQPSHSSGSHRQYTIRQARKKLPVAGKEVGDFFEIARLPVDAHWDQETLVIDVAERELRRIERSDKGTRQVVVVAEQGTGVGTVGGCHDPERMQVRKDRLGEGGIRYALLGPMDEDRHDSDVSQQGELGVGAAAGRGRRARVDVIRFFAYFFLLVLGYHYLACVGSPCRRVRVDDIRPSVCLFIRSFGFDCSVSVGTEKHFIKGIRVHIDLAVEHRPGEIVELVRDCERGRKRTRG